MTDYDQDKPSMMMRRGEGDDEDKIFAQILKFYHEKNVFKSKSFSFAFFGGYQHRV